VTPTESVKLVAAALLRVGDDSNAARRWNAEVDAFLEDADTERALESMQKGARREVAANRALLSSLVCLLFFLCI
jgi:hypothetical protein